MTTLTDKELIKEIRERIGSLDVRDNIERRAYEIALASLEREQIRHEHAKWSDSTFGCVGPIGPLKHLSKEALEAAAEPDDLSEWADMQFLLWDAQRRAGISDAEITAAMEDKLKINMERQWPEPKDGEPRLHIKEPGNSPVTPARLPGGFTIEDAKALHEDLVRSHISQALSGEKMKKNDRDADLRWIHGVIVQAAWFVKASLEQNALSGNYPVTPDGWISCSERMPDQDDWILIYSKHGEYMAGQVQGEYVELSDGTLSWLGNALFWMPLPEPPQG
ncbi:TPA: DUF550 domain-containing protein [Escherichia coli]|nr:DUF550 domain-containing protein [Escherichia coli]